MSLMSCSIHKLKSHILFTFCLFQFYVKKKKCSRKWSGVGLASPAPSPFVYGPVERTENLSNMVYNLLECSKSLAEDEVDEIMANYSNISQLKVESKIPTRQLRTEKSQKKSSSMNQSSESTWESYLVMNGNWLLLPLKLLFTFFFFSLLFQFF